MIRKKRVVDKPNKALGLTCGTLMAWLSTMVFYAIVTANIETTSDLASFAEFLLVVMLPLHFIFGLPLAVIICFTFGGLAWYICEALHLTKMRHALFGGAVVGLTLGGLLWAMDRSSGSVETLTYFAVPMIIGSLSAFVTHRYGYKDVNVPSPRC